MRSVYLFSLQDFAIFAENDFSRFLEERRITGIEAVLLTRQLNSPICGGSVY